MRRAKEPWLPAEQIAQHLRTMPHLRARSTLADEPRMPVAIRMIAYLVPFGHRSTNQLWIALRLFADHKERGMHAHLRQHVQHAWREARIRQIGRASCREGAEV